MEFQVDIADEQANASVKYPAMALLSLCSSSGCRQRMLHTHNFAYFSFPKSPISRQQTSPSSLVPKRLPARAGPNSFPHYKRCTTAAARSSGCGSTYNRPQYTSHHSSRSTIRVVSGKSIGPEAERLSYRMLKRKTTSLQFLEDMTSPKCSIPSSNDCASWLVFQQLFRTPDAFDGTEIEGQRKDGGAASSLDAFYIVFHIEFCRHSIPRDDTCILVKRKKQIDSKLWIYEINQWSDQVRRE